MRAIALVFAFLLSYCNAFELMKLGEFKDQNVSGWLVSEKLDGIRAYWDGQNLLSRNGVKLVVPSEFVASFPPFALDGELFSKRGEFEKIQSIVMDKSPNLKEWQDVKFYVFDVPEASGGLLSRLEVLHKFLLKHPSQYIAVIEQIKLKDNAQLYEIYNDITQNDGEGVVIRNPKTAYIGGRSQMNLKFKSFKDDECEVIAINLGKGKYSDKMGSLTCKKDDKIFKIGSGFSDELRDNPPKIGDIITYKYQNLTKNGLPRFGVFLRVRKD